MKMTKRLKSLRMTQGNPIGNIRTTELFLLYDNYFGDSLTACRLSVYELGGRWERDTKHMIMRVLYRY